MGEATVTPSDFANVRLAVELSARPSFPPWHFESAFRPAAVLAPSVDLNFIKVRAQEGHLVYVAKRRRREEADTTVIVVLDATDRIFTPLETTSVKGESRGNAPTDAIIEPEAIKEPACEKVRLEQTRSYQVSAPKLRRRVFQNSLVHGRGVELPEHGSRARGEGAELEVGTRVRALLWLRL